MRGRPKYLHRRSFSVTLFAVLARWVGARAAAPLALERSPLIVY